MRLKKNQQQKDILKHSVHKHKFKNMHFNNILVKIAHKNEMIEFGSRILKAVHCYTPKVVYSEKFIHLNTCNRKEMQYIWAMKLGKREI